MNAARRKSLDAIFAMIEEAKSQLETLRDEEQETYDNLPESFQNGEKGEKAQTAIDAMESAISNIEDACNEIETAKE